MGAVIHKEPDWSALGANIPATVRIVLQRCLEKDPKRRLRDVGDVRLALDGAFETHEPAASASAPASAAPRWRGAAVLAAVAVAASIAAGTAVWSLTRTMPAIVSPVRFTIAPPAQTQLVQFFALSPDGRSLAFFVTESGPQRLAVHSLETGETRVLARAGVVSGAPFWSPDSRLIGFVGEGKLKKIDTAGGPAEAICEGPNFAAGTWGADGTILFATATRGVMRVSASGGTPTQLTAVDPARKEVSHTGPWLLPGGRRFLYLRSSTEPGNAGLY